MTDSGTPDKHHVVLTQGQYLALKRLTGGGQEHQTDFLKDLRTELDRAQLQARTNRYHVWFTLQNLRSAAYVLRVNALRNGQRHINRLMRDYGDLMESGRV